MPVKMLAKDVDVVAGNGLVNDCKIPFSTSSDSAPL